MSLLACLLRFSLHLLYSFDDVIDFVYNGFSGANLTVDDSAMVTPDGVLMLTNSTYLMKGHAIYPTLFHFHAPPSTTGVLSFLTTFAFAILSEYADLSAYGLAFFVAPTKNFSAMLSSQYFGLFDTSNVGNATNHIFAVELDTLLNVEFGDMDSNHVSVDINGLKSVKAVSVGYYDDNKNDMFHNLSLMSGKAMQVWVDYDSRSTQISVTLAPVRVPKPKKPLISYIFDLSTLITDAAYIGFTSSLGTISSRHCVLGVE